MKEIKPPATLSISDLNKTWIFLAGSIEMGLADEWQKRLVNKFEDHDLIFLNPRRDDWDSSWPQDPTPGTKFYEQVTWELDFLKSADLVVFYFDPATESPITLMELGYAVGSSKNIMVCCPDGFYRKGNVVITCDLADVTVLNTLEELVESMNAWLTED